MHLLLHIGPHKTGSSSIQYALRDGREALAENGVLYYAPDPFPAWSLAALYATEQQRAHPMLRQKFPTDAAVVGWSREVWAGLERAVAGSDAGLCVLSSEHFASLYKNGSFLTHLGRLFSGITVLAYARAPVALYLSAFQQNIQGGQCLRDLKSPRSYKYVLRRQLEPYIESLGLENVILRNFQRDSLAGGDVVADFQAQMCRFAPKVTIPLLNINESLPGAAIAWLLMVNETWDHSALTEMRRKVISRLKRSPAVAALPNLQLDEPALVAFIQARARDDVDWLNQTFLGDQVPLDPGSMSGDGVKLPPEPELRARMRRWIMGYLTPEAIEIIAEEVIWIPKKRAGK